MSQRSTSPSRGSPATVRRATSGSAASARQRVVVIGASGTQGGAVALALLADRANFDVVVVGRSADRLRDFGASGATVAIANLKDTEALAKIFGQTPGTAIFAITTPFPGGIADQRAQFASILEASRRARVRHIVYSSVSHCQEHTGIPHLDSQAEFENQLCDAEGHVLAPLREAGIEAVSIVQPPFFMDNFKNKEFGMVPSGGLLRIPVSSSTSLTAIATSDIARVVVAAIKLHGIGIAAGRLEIAGDHFTCAEAAETMTRLVGTPIRHVRFPGTWFHWPLLRMFAGEDLQKMFYWFETTGFDAKRSDAAIARTRALLGGDPPVSLEKFVRDQTPFVSQGAALGAKGWGCSVQ